MKQVNFKELQVGKVYYIEAFGKVDGLVCVVFDKVEYIQDPKDVSTRPVHYLADSTTFYFGTIYAAHFVTHFSNCHSFLGFY